jgi:hypothetical protein
VNSPPETQGLHDTLRAFAAALRTQATDQDVTAFAEAIVEDGLPAEARLRVYRNNGHAVFADALQRTYPVLRRRVGDEFFARLAAEYREAHPSRRGDLHWIGAHFPEWLGPRLDGTGYEWLADVARLEWACEESLVAEAVPAIDLAALGAVPPEMLDDTSLQLSPALRLVASSYPIWSVWQENQPAGPGRPIDLSSGSECVAVSSDRDGLMLRRLPAGDCSFVSSLAEGASLGAAVEASGLPVERLPDVLRWLFAERLVTAVRAPLTGQALSNSPTAR